MPFALVIIGLVMIVTGARDTYAAFGAQVRKDFTGPGNFTFWLASLGAVGAVGYVPKLKPLAIAFMTLIIVAMLLSNRGFFAKLQEALNNGPIAPPRNAPAGGAENTTGERTGTPNTIDRATDAGNALGVDLWGPLFRWVPEVFGGTANPIPSPFVPNVFGTGTPALEPMIGNPMVADPNPFDAPAPTGGVLPNNWFGN